MPEPRFSGSSTLQLSYFRFKTVYRQSSPPNRHTAAAMFQLPAASCRRRSSTRSAPSTATSRHYAPSSRPSPLLAAEDMLGGPVTDVRVLLPSIYARSVGLLRRLRWILAPAWAFSDASISGTLTPTHPKPCCLHPGYRRGLGCRAPRRRDRYAPHRLVPTVRC